MGIFRDGIVVSMWNFSKIQIMTKLMLLFTCASNISKVGTFHHQCYISQIACIIKNMDDNKGAKHR